MKRTPFKQPTYEQKLAKAKLAQERQMKKKATKPKTPPKKPAERKNKPRKTTQASKLRRKKGIWSTDTADKYFSRWIRERDGKCLNCGTTERLTCSHYYRRGHSSTRWDPKNCITLCLFCHSEWEGPKYIYTQHMIDWLGEEELLKLEKKAGTFMKRSDAVAEFKEWYRNL